MKYCFYVKLSGTNVYGMHQCRKVHVLKCQVLCFIKDNDALLGMKLEENPGSEIFSMHGGGALPKIRRANQANSAMVQNESASEMARDSKWRASGYWITAAALGGRKHSVNPGRPNPATIEK